MSIVNTGIGFDSELFIKNNNHKLVYKSRNKDNQQIENKRTVAKIFKMDENNKYGNAMTKPLPTGCIKKYSYTPNYRELQLLLEGLSHTDEIGHLFIVDIEFNFNRVTEKELIFNEIYTPLFEKKKVLPACERSVFQLLDAMRFGTNDVLNVYKCTGKAYSTMEKNICYQFTLNA